VKHFHSRSPRGGSARRHGHCNDSGYLEESQHKPDYKTAQLCKQTFRTLCQSLAGDCGDPVLQNLVLESVTPAPDASRLLVTVLAKPGDAPVDLTSILHRLEQVKGMLRAAVAEAIYRKKAPELTFLVLPMPEVPT
jgi:ribosome-binding factor A